MNEENKVETAQTANQTTAQPVAQPAWKPLTRTERRVVGVLVEKAKTTPDAYPMTLNALTTGCNQKNNRYPLTNLTADEVQETLEQLKKSGAVTEVQSAGRTAKFRHNLYTWLGVDKVELAVMGELLLRGEQTLGELRTRAARMEPIADVAELRPIVKGLIEKRLMQALTPEGRGQVVSHNLYMPEEHDKLARRVESMASQNAGDEAETGSTSRGVSSRSSSSASASTGDRQVAELQEQVNEVRQELAELRERLAALEKAVGSV